MLFIDEYFLKTQVHERSIALSKRMSDLFFQEKEETHITFPILIMALLVWNFLTIMSRANKDINASINVS